MPKTLLLSVADSCCPPTALRTGGKSGSYFVGCHSSGALLVSQPVSIEGSWFLLDQLIDSGFASHRCLWVMTSPRVLVAMKCDFVPDSALQDPCSLSSVPLVILIYTDTIPSSLSSTSGPGGLRASAGKQPALCPGVDLCASPWPLSGVWMFSCFSQFLTHLKPSSFFLTRKAYLWLS